MMPNWWWPSLSSNLRLSASSSLPIFELDRSHVQKRYARLGTFVPGIGFANDPMYGTSGAATSLQFSDWRLAHAIVKADFLTKNPLEWVARIGALLQLHPVTDWRGTELRLRNGAATAMADFSGTSLGGRIGQGAALLFAEARGYGFVSHFPRMAGAKGPDFLVEGRGRVGRAMMEAKGSFVRPGSTPRIKGVLKEGLDQMPVKFTRGASKSFVVATFLRERGDPSIEPSMIAFVDPEDDPVDRGDEPPDQVRRDNYAAWLRVMGYFDAAADLQSREEVRDRSRERVATVEFEGRSFAIVPVSPWFEARSAPHVHGRGYVVAGLDWSVLKAVEASLPQPGSFPETPSNIGLADRGFVGSVLADGSMLGVLSERQLARAQEETIWL